MRDRIVNARRTNQLAYDYTLCPVNYESTGAGHQWQVAHEYFMLIDFVCFFVVKSYSHLKWRSVSRITFFTLFNRVLHVILAQSKINKFQA